MLSILIPTFNYNVYPLVDELEAQALKAKINFEIICIDDGSFSILNEQNQKINALTNCKFIENKKNIGRSKIRNLLAKKAKYDWLLFLDADVSPKNSNFLITYINSVDKNSEIIYGGILYKDHSPKQENMLRWVYGNEREALPVTERDKNKYMRFLTLNFLIKKSVFKKVLFNETIPNKRHEDTLFAYDIKKNKINLVHIDNPVYHLGLDTSKIFLKKSLESVESLLFLVKNKLLASNFTKLTKIFKICKTIYLNRIFAYSYKKYQNKLEENLLSDKPSLLIFDLYRLFYLCYLDKNK